VAVSETANAHWVSAVGYIDSANRSWAHLISSVRQLRASARHCTAVFSGLERREPGLRFSCLSGLLVGKNDGGAGIRTQETLARPTVFKTAPFDRSGTPPGQPSLDAGYGSASNRSTTARLKP
jgi:hypothetical protein